MTTMQPGKNLPTDDVPVEEDPDLVADVDVVREASGVSSENETEIPEELASARTMPMSGRGSPSDLSGFSSAAKLLSALVPAEELLVVEEDCEA